MSISLPSARRVAASAVGASAVAGAMLFGAIPAANAASTTDMAPTDTGSALHVAPAFWGHNHHHHTHRHGGLHIGGLIA